jgi:competence protein ComEA
MLRSFFIKLAMLAATMGAVFWIGWSMPSSIGEGQRGGVKAVTEPVMATNAKPALSNTTTPQGLSEQLNREATVAGKSLSASTKQGHQLDLNRATAAELQQLPGVGPVLAKRMLDHRKRHGAFVSVDDLLDVKGIGRKKMARLRPLVMVQATAPAQSEKGRL